jgi:hypothetical protein
MVLADEISKLQQDLADAETDLQDSLSEVNQRVEAVDVRPQIEKLIREHPLASASLAAAAGFALASRTSRGRLITALALGVFLGLQFASDPEKEQGPES